MTNSSVLAIIPARGGSKGLPGKNIAPLGGKPLIAWTIKAALAAKYVTDCIVTSDDDEILHIATESGSDILKRPAKLATDQSSSESAITHALLEMQKQGKEYDYMILLQPTSPFRDQKDINAAFTQMIDKNATAAISVNETDNKILKAFKENDTGHIEGIGGNDYPFMRRQDLPRTYMSNGAIYIIKVDEFLKNKKLITNNTVAYKMSAEKSHDIDTAEDLVNAQKMINQNLL